MLIIVTPRRSPLARQVLQRALFSLLSAVAMLATTGPAQAWTRSGTLTGPAGQTVQHQATHSQGNVSSSTTGPNGYSTSRTVDRSAAGTTATVTGPNGQSINRVTSRSAGSTQGTVTGPNGQTVSRSVTRQP